MGRSTLPIVILALTAITSAVPLRRRQNACIVDTVLNPSVTQIEVSINQWNVDVNNVNAFLNNASTLIAANNSAALGAAASSALTNAEDEPCQLMTLASQPDLTGLPDAFSCAVTELMSVFSPQVITPLMDIVANPGDTNTVTSAVATINQARCCAVLPDVSILWLDSADDSGISNLVPTVANRENACSTITCSPKCDAVSNS